MTTHPECNLKSVLVPHAPEVRALAHRVAFGGAAVVYSGDTRAVPEIMVPLTEGADLLIHEAYSEAGLADWTRDFDRPMASAISDAFERTHTNIRVAAQIAEAAGAKRLALTHLNPGERPERLRAEAAGYFKGEIVVAADGLELEV
jgi:ribonuclease BN (tRNA processing enzyme)